MSEEIKATPIDPLREVATVFLAHKIAPRGWASLLSSGSAVEEVLQKYPYMGDKLDELKYGFEALAKKANPADTVEGFRQVPPAEIHSMAETGADGRIQDGFMSTREEKKATLDGNQLRAASYVGARFKLVRDAAKALALGEDTPADRLVFLSAKPILFAANTVAERNVLMTIHHQGGSAQNAIATNLQNDVTAIENAYSHALNEYARLANVQKKELRVR